VLNREMSGPFLKELFNVPNTMSIFRVMAAPLLAILWLGLEWRIAGLALGLIAGITDQLDGYVARKLGQTTALGALIDQLGDLVFESICLLIGVLSGYLWSGLLIIYLFREFTVNVIRSYVIGNGGSLPSLMLGKVKSSCLQWAFFILFLGGILIDPVQLPIRYNLVGISPGQGLIWMANAWIVTGLIVGIIAASIYFKIFVSFYISQQKPLPSSDE
jgi:CDP-diacylglycerol--glycerol-3-phosphate 3-phosphatidyltransferase